MKFDWIVSSHGRFGSGTAWIRSVGKTSKSEKFREYGAVLPGGDWATQFLFQRGSGGVTGM